MADVKEKQRIYPQSFHPYALWNKEEVCGYLEIKSTYFHQIEALIPTFKVGRERVAYAKDVIAYSLKECSKENPFYKTITVDELVNLLLKGGPNNEQTARGQA